MAGNPCEWNSGLTPESPTCHKSVWWALMPSIRFVSTPTVSQDSMPYPALFYSCINALHREAQSHAHNPSYQLAKRLCQAELCSGSGIPSHHCTLLHNESGLWWYLGHLSCLSPQEAIANWNVWHGVEVCLSVVSRVPPIKVLVIDTGYWWDSCVMSSWKFSSRFHVPKLLPASHPDIQGINLMPHSYNFTEITSLQRPHLQSQSHR